MKTAGIMERIESLIETGVVNTWSDGYGIWHATVPDSLGEKVAQAAIWFELRARYDTRLYTMPRPRVELRRSLTHTCDKPECWRAEYVEVWCKRPGRSSRVLEASGGVS